MSEKINSQDIRRNPEKWKALQELVASGVSLTEIRRTLGIDYRSVRRHFPDYRPFRVGGGGEAQIIRQVNQDLRRIDNHGNMSTRRGKT
jgi:hypothetical protein